MNEHVWWYVARATGIVAWAVSAASVLWGMALSTRALGARPRAPWLLDLHRFLGGLTVLFVGGHLGALVADSYVDFGVRDLLIPFASSWKPLPVAFGVVALYLLLAVEVTSLLRNRLPKRIWRGVHLSSYGAYLAASVHFLAAGSDAANDVLRVGVVLTGAAMSFFLVYLVVGPGKAASVKGNRPAREPVRRVRDAAELELAERG
jgi:DMSO/TMAO reductase YedYZ heme-binding membrane subunit